MNKAILVKETYSSEAVKLTPVRAAVRIGRYCARRVKVAMENVARAAVVRATVVKDGVGRA